MAEPKKKKIVSERCAVNASASVERTKGREKVAVQKSSKSVERERAVAARKTTAPVKAAAAIASWLLAAFPFLRASSFFLGVACSVRSVSGDIGEVR